MSHNTKTSPLNYSPEQVPIQDAATVVVIRDSQAGPEVLMQQRSPDAVFVGGAWVFPGGKVDPQDQSPQWLEHFDLTDESLPNRVLGQDRGGLAYWVACIRETLEEAGLLIGLNSPVTQENIDRIRQQLLDAPDSWLALCQQHSLSFQWSALQFLSRWVTPIGPPRRFDTRFFITCAPSGQQPVHDDWEAVATRWLTPAQALQEHQNGEMDLIFPTLMTLKGLSGYHNCKHLLANVIPSASTKPIAP